MAAGIQPITAGNAGWRGVNEWFVTMFWNHYSGPDALYQALTGQIPWTDPVFVEPLQILQKWFQNGLDRRLEPGLLHHAVRHLLHRPGQR